MAGVTRVMFCLEALTGHPALGHSSSRRVRAGGGRGDGCHRWRACGLRSRAGQGCGGVGLVDRIPIFREGR